MGTPFSKVMASFFVVMDLFGIFLALLFFRKSSNNCLLGTLCKVESFEAHLFELIGKFYANNTTMP